MKMIRHIARHANLLNALLLAISVIVAVFVFLSLTHMDRRYSLPGAQHKTPVEGDKKQTEKGSAPTPADFAVIGEMNLFHPERITPVEKKADMPRPELVLYSTMVSDAVQFAMIEDKKSPKTSPGRGNRQTVVKKGDVVSGFIVTGITTDSIVLTKGNEQMEVHISDEEKRKEQNAPQSRIGRLPAARPASQTRPAAAMPVIPRQNQPSGPVSPGQTTGSQPQTTRGAAPGSR